jgi:hypothetical protein
MSKVAKRYDVSSAKTPEDFLAITGLNWEPQVRQAGFMPMLDDPAAKADAGSFRAIVQPITGQAMAFVSPRFKPNSHVKALHDVWGLVGHGAIVPHGASVWDGGRRIAMQFRAPELDVMVGPKSVISPLLTLVVNHDSTGADRSFFADFDFWCRNQDGIVQKIQGEGVRHSSGVLSKYEDLLESRIRSLRDGDKTRYGLMQRMANGRKDLKGVPLLNYFATALDLAPTSVQDTIDVSLAAKASGTVEVLSAEGKILKAVVADWRADDHGVPNTAWHAYSAVTRYTTHTEGRNEATRLQRAMLGSQDRYTRAFTEAARLVL